MSRHPGALVITSDMSTCIVKRLDVGTGATHAAAEATALLACQVAVSGPGVQCVIAASGC